MFADRPGDEGTEYVALHFMQMPANVWRLYDVTRRSRGHGDPSDAYAAAYALRQASFYADIRNALYEVAGGEVLPVKGNITLTRGLLEAEGFAIDVVNGHLRLGSQHANEHRRRVIQVHKDRVKVWEHDMRELHIAKRFTWHVKQDGDSATRKASELTATGGRVTIRHSGKKLVIDLHEGKVRARSGEEVMIAPQIELRLATMEVTVAEGD